MAADPVDSSRREFLESELRTLDEARQAASPGTQAWAAVNRQFLALRAELDGLADTRPTRGMPPAEILSTTLRLARGLPDPVLAVFADVWALRHNLQWVPRGTEEP